MFGSWLMDVELDAGRMMDDRAMVVAYCFADIALPDVPSSPGVDVTSCLS